MVKNSSVRKIVSLDGLWQIIFDPENKGKRGSWFKKEVFDLQEKVPIRVPSCWEETQLDYEGVAWYGCNFNVPDIWKDKVIRLKFGAVNYVAEVWLNNQVVGFHEGGYTPFEFDIADLLKFKEENFLVVRVIGPLITRDEVIDGIGRDDVPHWRGAITGGIWQSVELIATESIFVRDVFIEPKVSEKLAIVHIEIENTGLRNRDLSAVFKASNWKGSAGVAAQVGKRVTLEPGSNSLSVDLKIDNPVSWSPENPHLYVAEVRLVLDDKVIDQVETRFGMREFTIRDGHFCLNGKPIYLKAGFWEGFYPTTLAYPPDTAFVRKEILLAKKAGFNTLRPWRKPPPPPILDLADELGMCIIGCPPIECMNRWPSLTPQLEKRIVIELREMVLRDRNHPSVIYWELFNEIQRPALARLKHKMALLARGLDPTRMIVDESAGVAGGAHTYPPYSREPMSLNEIHSYLRSPVDQKTYDFYLTLGEPGKLTFVSEVGYGGLPDLPHNVERYKREGNPKTPDYRYHEHLLESLEKCIKEHGLYEAFKDASEVCLATQEIQAVGNKLQLEALRMNPKIDGYCLHAFTDGDWVLGAGIVDVWREPKKVYSAVQEVNKPIYLAVQANLRNAYADKEIKLMGTAVSEAQETACRWIVEVKSPKGEQVYQKEGQLTLKPGIQPVFELNLRSEALSGRYVLTAKLEKEGVTLSENAYPFLVFDQRSLEAPQQGFAIVDPEGLLKPFLADRGLKFSDFTIEDEGAKPVFVSTTRGADEPDVFEKFIHLFNLVRRGGIVVFLKPPIDRDEGLIRVLERRFGIHAMPPEKNILLGTGLFPFKLKGRIAYGHWVGVYHYVKKHPIFEGLPVNCFMGQDYQNVCGIETITELGGETLVGSLSWSYEENYIGPRDVWGGSDLAIVSYGRGKIILSTLQLIENLGKDPVADKIFYNMVTFAASKSIKPSEPLEEELKSEVKKYMGKFENMKVLK